MAEDYYKTGSQLQKEKLQQRRNEEIGAISALTLFAIGAGLVLYHQSKQPRTTMGVGSLERRELRADEISWLNSFGSYKNIVNYIPRADFYELDTLVNFFRPGTVEYLRAVTRRNNRYTANVGSPLRDTQMAIPFDFYDPSLHQDIEEAWDAFEKRNWPVYKRADYSMLDGAGIVVDRLTGDEYPEETVFEVYKQFRYGDRPMEFLHDITGDELERLSIVLNGDIDKAKKFGYNLYIYQDGTLIETVE